jgi:CHAT domain-containing protein
MMKAKLDLHQVDDLSRYAANLSESALNYQQMGDDNNVLKLYEEALQITLEIQGKTHRNYADRLTKLGGYYFGKGMLDRALEYYQEAASVLEISLTKEHEDYAAALQNQAKVFIQNGALKNAEELLENALEITKKSIGEDHPDYGSQLSDLALLYRKSNENEKAIQILEEALLNTKTALGKNHVRYGEIHGLIAGTYREMGNHEKALPALIEENNNRLFQINQRFDQLSNRLQLSFLNKLNPGFFRLQSIALDQKEMSELNQLSFSNSLLTNQLLLSNRKNLLQSLRSHKNSDIREKFEQWTDLNQILTHQYELPANSRIPTLDSIENLSEEIEIWLAGNVKEFREARDIVNGSDVIGKLDPGEAAIEFSHFPYYNGDEKTEVVKYVAYILRPEYKQPRLVYLFDEEELNIVVAPKGRRQADYVSALYGYESRGARRVEADAKSLYELIWQPLDSLLNGVKTIYYAPTGMLHRINIGAIQLDLDFALADQYNWHQVGSIRNLVHTEAKSENSQKTATLFGGINYELDTTNTGDILAAVENITQTEPTTRGGDAWRALTWTGREVDEINTILTEAGYQVELYKEFDAEEEQFKSFGQTTKLSPRIIHLSTHGYFFEDPGSDAGKAREGVSSTQISEHPMIRSGLILAQGNYFWTLNQPLPGKKENGILNALEISQLDLSGTELVVLSACETNLGEIQGNEGVYGLQRAFKIAGVRYMIMSLWEVKDRQTKQLMTKFYDNLAEGLSIREAFKGAQDDMRENYGDAYYWAGFVLIE